MITKSQQDVKQVGLLQKQQKENIIGSQLHERATTAFK
jgi:hypothetical protein